MGAEELTWALLAPVPRERLAALAGEGWREEADDDVEDEEEFDDDEEESDGQGWEVIGGTGDYSAILDREPGSEYTDEETLAERISLKVKRPVYVLYLNEDFAETDAVAVYEGGRQTGSRRAPYALARSLGITLPGDPAAEGEAGVSGEASQTQVSGLVVAEGLSAAEAARSLGVSEPQTGPLHIVDISSGAIIYNDETGRVPSVEWDLSTAFPERDIYTLSTGPDEGRFVVSVMRGGEDRGTFDFPVPFDPEEGPVLDSVKGEATPRGIADALGVPRGLLDLEELR